MGDKQTVESVFDEWTDAIQNAKDTKTERPEVEVDVTFSPGELQPLILALANTLCRAFDVDRIDESDAHDIAVAAAPVITKYAGETWERYGKEIALAGVLAKVALPRVQEYSERRAEQRAEESVSFDEAREDEF